MVGISKRRGGLSGLSSSPHHASGSHSVTSSSSVRSSGTKTMGNKKNLFGNTGASYGSGSSSYYQKKNEKHHNDGNSLLSNEYTNAIPASSYQEGHRSGGGGGRLGGGALGSSSSKNSHHHSNIVNTNEKHGRSNTHHSPANMHKHDKLRLHLRNASSSNHYSENNHYKLKHSNANHSSTYHTSNNNNNKRIFDPMVLARGLSGRYIGCKIVPELKPLKQDEIQKDLRLMEAYSNACIMYSQKYFMYQNQNLVRDGYYDHVISDHQQPSLKKIKLDNAKTATASSPSSSPTHPNSGAAAAATSISNIPVHLPVKIDPEEEKRIATLRKKISLSESQREILETQYLSLRANYVHENHRLKHLNKVVEAQITLFQIVCRNRQKVLALRRLRVGVFRELLAFAQEGLLDENQEDFNTLLNYWNELEQELLQAEKACVEIDFESHIRSDSKDIYQDNVFVWENSYTPKTPYAVPLYLSTLTYAPDKTAGVSYSSSCAEENIPIQFISSNCPPTSTLMQKDHETISSLKQDVQNLLEECQREHEQNIIFHEKLHKYNEKSNEICSFLHFLRNFSDNTIYSHNVVLDTPMAKTKAKELYKKQRAREEEEAQKESEKRKLDQANTTTKENEKNTDDNEGHVPLDEDAAMTHNEEENTGHHEDHHEDDVAAEDADNEHASSEEDDDEDEDEEIRSIIQVEDDNPLIPHASKPLNLKVDTKQSEGEDDDEEEDDEDMESIEDDSDMEEGEIHEEGDHAGTQDDDQNNEEGGETVHDEEDIDDIEELSDEMEERQNPIKEVIVSKKKGKEEDEDEDDEEGEILDEDEDDIEDDYDDDDDDNEELLPPGLQKRIICEI